jgi:tetratricopeptide (TPR) repeat protein
VASIIEGYNYDIFISYRQKDNKHDGWVTEFVDNLKGELESTFKEEISVYFDINPSDYLLETYDVDASLKDKLKCLIFIPIISRTYCDPKSFAWEHEFKAFVELASHDQFGLKIKLPNGNVASRVLPIRIHDLDPDDFRLCESVLGGVLRGVEFIYKEAGIDKPLAPGDNEKKNLNNTTYRIQIIKVAHAIKEIISGLKIEPGKEIIQHQESSKEIKREVGKEVQEKLYKQPKRKVILGGIFISVLLLIAAILAYPKLFKRDILEKLRSSGERISVAVMPFQNMTNDTTWNVWQDGIQDMLINSLSNSEELKIRQSESINNLFKHQGIVNYASITPSVAGTISQKLDANVFIYGNIKQAGNIIRLYAQLIDTKTKDVFKSFQIESINKEDVIFNIIDSLSVMIKNFLIITELGKKLPPYFKDYKSVTSSPEAFRYMLYSRKALSDLDYPAAQNWLLQAISIDSNFFDAILRLSIVYQNKAIATGNQNLYDQAKKWCLRAFGKRDQMPPNQKVMTNWLYSTYFETPNEEIKYLKQLLDFDDQNPSTYTNLGVAYYVLYQFDKAIPEFEKALEIKKRWGTESSWIFNYIYLGESYHKVGIYKKERKLYKDAEQHFHGNSILIYHQAILSLSEGDTIAANRYIEKYVTICKSRSDSEASVTDDLAMIYSEAGNLNKAERYFRQALSLEPEKAWRLNNLAYFLIDKDRNVNEGMDLINKALGKDTTNYTYWACKGWGLFKQKKYEEALNFLQKADSLKPVYDHDLFLQLEKAKKAIANQKNN